MEPPSQIGVYKFSIAAAVTTLVGFAGLTVTVVLAVRSLHAARDVRVLWKYLVIALPAAAVACIGVVLLLMAIVAGGSLLQFRQAIAAQTQHTSPAGTH
jgi:hypothetical protein